MRECVWGRVGGGSDQTRAEAPLTWKPVSSSYLLLQRHERRARDGQIKRRGRREMIGAWRAQRSERESCTPPWAAPRATWTSALVSPGQVPLIHLIFNAVAPLDSQTSAERASECGRHTGALTQNWCTPHTHIHTQYKTKKNRRCFFIIFFRPCARDRLAPSSAIESVSRANQSTGAFVRESTRLARWPKQKPDLGEMHGDEDERVTRCFRSVQKEEGDGGGEL